MKLQFSLVLLALLLATPAPALITYRDEKGTLHAVKSEEEIPEQYRKKTKRLKNTSGSPEIPGIATLTTVKGLQLVDVNVASLGTYKFVVDSKEWVTTVNSEIAGALKLPAVDRATIATYKGTVKAKMVLLPEISVAGHSVSNVKVAVAEQDPELGAVGRLGASFLNGFDVKIDTEENRLFIEPKKKVQK
jgi:hypothetical protein